MSQNTPPFDLIRPPPADAEAYERLLQRDPPSFLSDHKQAAARYQPSDELLLAINMALHTGSPLLLTGEPGTGKTQAANFISRYFNIKIYKFLVKSTSVAQDLLYEFDAVGYLHWAQAAGKTLSADVTKPVEGIAAETDAIREGFLHKRALWQAYDDTRDSVVLIDEIDKAPRDFPNDLLHEFDQHEFPHPFDQSRLVKPQAEKPPIIVITSNDERRLPDAFLRRCIFHRINLTPELIKAAVDSMVEAGGFPNLGEDTLDAARACFQRIRDSGGLEKYPSTAELLTWLSILSARNVKAEQLQNRALSQLPSIGALIKDIEDLKRLG